MKAESIKTYIHYAIIICFFLFFKYIPAPNGLPPISMEIVGIFLGTLWGWITVSMGWPSILGILAFGLSDYITMNEALRSSFGSQIIIMVLALLLLASFVEQSNLTDFVLDFLMKRKTCKGRPYVIFLYFLLAGFVASLLSYCNAVFIIFIGFFKSMMEKTGIKPYSSAVPCFFIGMIIAILFADLSLPFKSTAIYCIGTYEAITGNHIDIFKYVAMMIPICLMCIVLHVLVCKYIFRADLSPLAHYAHESSKNVRLTKRQKISLLGILCGMLCLLVPSIIPASWSLKPIVDELGGGGLALFVIAILMAIRVDNEPLMDLKKVANHFPWPIFFCMAFLFPVAGAISSDSVGIKQFITSNGEVFFRTIPTILAIVLLIVLPAILTNFMNNAVIGIISLSIYGTIASSIALDPNIVFCMIAFAVNLGFWFPAANPMSAIAFGETSIVRFRQMALYGLGSWCIQCVWIGVACFFFGSFIF